MQFKAAAKWVGRAVLLLLIFPWTYGLLSIYVLPEIGSPALTSSEILPWFLMAIASLVGCGWLAVWIIRKPSSKSPRKVTLWLKVPLAVAAIICNVMCMGYILVWIGEMWLQAYVPNSALQFRRQEMESIVAQVRRQSFSGDATFAWTDAVGSPKLLQFSQMGAHEVDAERSVNGKLKVIIWTWSTHENWGVSENQGWCFAYSDDTLTPGYDQSVVDSDQLVLTLPNSGYIATDRGMRIDAHWWRGFTFID